MNELRMYVEHLFEGRVLTSENIELKEEIYGNLVARYEDLRDQGLSEADALASTKASITSVDDFIAEEAANASAAAADPAPAMSVPATASMPRMVEAEVVDEDGPTRGTSDAKPQRPWLKIAGIAAAALIGLGLIGGVVYEAVIEPAQDRAEEQAERAWYEQQLEDSSSSDTPAANGAGSGSGAGSGNGSGNGNGSGSGQGAGRLAFGDADDPYEYEASMALADEIMATTVGDLAPYRNQAPTAEVLNALPMSAFVYAAEFGQTGDELNIAYRAVHDALDDDAVDCAMTYGAASLMAIYPEVNTVIYTLHEHDHDRDVYRYTRTAMEQALSQASGGSISQLAPALIDAQDSWDAMRSCVTTASFFDYQTEIAEVG